MTRLVVHGLGTLIGIWFGLSVSTVTANTFCNMDEAGGDKGKEAQRKSALAAAKFFDGAAKSFEMLASVERHVAGEKGALEKARELSKDGVAQLNESAKEFQAISRDKKALEAIDNVLKQVTGQDYAKAFGLAKYTREAPIGKEVEGVFGKASAAEVMQACGKSVSELTDREKPMGSVFAAVGEGKVAAPESIWAAIAQWNEALIRGRLVSSIFRVVGEKGRR